MTIEFHCPHCQHVLVTDDEKAGRAAKCPGCGSRIEIPAAFEESPSNQVGGDSEAPRTDTRPCPVCGAEIKRAAVKCRYCQAGVEVLDTPVGGQQHGVGPVDSQVAVDLVKAPAMSLMVMTGINMLLQLVVVVINMVQVGGWDNPGGPAEWLILVASVGLSLVTSCFIIYGCRKMMKLERYGVSIAVCVMSMVPCFSSCVCIGLPLGIWGVVVLMKPEVKSAFVS